MHNAKPVSTVQLANSQAVTAEITTYVNENAPTSERWHSELRFFSTELNDKATFKVFFDGQTQEQTIQVMMTLYNDFVVFFENQYSHALGLIARGIDDPGARGQPVALKISSISSIGPRVRSFSPASLTLSGAGFGQRDVHVHVKGENNEQAMTLAVNTLLQEIRAYMNQQFAARLGRLSKHLQGIDIAKTHPWTA